MRGTEGSANLLHWWGPPARICWQTLPMRNAPVGLLILAVLGLTACGSSGSSPTPTTLFSDLPGVLSFGDAAHPLDRDHVDTAVSYPQSPPVGGRHSGIWQNCGIYDTPVKNENAVHSLEHGAVWLAYRPDLTAADIETVRSLARQHSHVLVSPYPGLTEPVVATAWGKQLRLDSVSDPLLGAFAAKYEEGPQTPELGAPCDGALGTPIE